MISTNNNITTEILSAHSPADLFKAAQILKNGGIVALPTETVYGLAANGFCPNAVGKIYRAKERPANNPLIYHIHQTEGAASLFHVDMLSGQPWQRFMRLTQKFWPGPLTIVAQRAAHMGGFGCADLPHIAVRMPNSTATLSIMRSLDFPLVMPSANISTRPSPTQASHVLKTLNHRIHAIVDGGDCGVGIESSVVSIHGSHVKILRPGSIAKVELEECLGEKISDIHDSDSLKPQCPGQAYLHYSPKVRSVSVRFIEEAEPIWSSSTQIIGRTCDLAILQERYGQRSAHSPTIALSDDPKNFAKELYGALYSSEDKDELDLVAIAPPQTDAWEAVYNRLQRACGKQIKPL